MSSISTPPNTTEDGDRFPSLSAFRVDHGELLKRHREKGKDPEFLTEIGQFIQKGRATGAILDIEDDRWAAQSILDYWSSLLYRAGQEPPDATLIDFNPELAPVLSDDLCPYMGLEAFREKNQNLFFGRQALVEKLLKHLQTNRLLIVVGSSGSGKSSVVMGGLLPRLSSGGLPGSQDWFYYQPFVPGSDPLAALAQRLKPSEKFTSEWIPQQVLAFKQDPNHLVQLVKQIQGQPIVLVIDQFEEVFTLCQNAETRLALIKNLLNFVQNLTTHNILILTMRADFESQFARVPEIFQLLDSSLIRVTALDASELRETIEKPAESVGLKFEEGLVDKLLNDVLGEPTALPLLQFTLLKLWDNRDNNRVTWEAYQRLGGGRLALAKSADDFYKNLIPEEQLTAKRILLRMVRPSEGLEVTSNRITREELYTSGEASDRIDRVLDKLIKARLIRLTEGDTPEDAQIEVAHEALIRNWPQLVDWIEDKRNDLRKQFRLEASAQQWVEKGRQKDYLLKGEALKDAQRYQEEKAKDFVLPLLVTEFIQRSHKETTIGRLRFFGLFLIPIVVVGGFSLQRQNTIDSLINRVAQARGQKNSKDRITALQELVTLGQSLGSFTLNETNLSGADLTGADLTGADLTRANLSRTTLTRAKLIRANLKEANLSDTKLDEVKLYGSELSGIDLSRANLSQADLRAASLEKARLNKAKLYQVQLSYSTLTGADLTGANFTGANLTGANLTGANFTEANLTGANFTEANLTGADLTGANFTGANLTGADFRSDQKSGSVKNLTIQQVMSAKNWQKAKFDDSFRRQLTLSADKPK